MQLLIIGTLGGQIGAASKIAMEQGAKVSHVDTVAEGLNVLRSGQGVELVMIDVVLDVAELMTGLESERITTLVVACGVANDSQAAVRAIKAGAREYIPLPPNAELIGAVLAAVTEESHAIVFRDPAMEETLRMAKQVAPSEANILVNGSSGTGKELVSRFIHRNSKRKSKRFVAINCAAIPENLLESELFGHEKGAFTGAIARRIGKFEEANGGTLLLDEISEMDVRLQSKLLRVIQEREIDRIGSTKPIKVDVRIIATSNRNLQKAVADGDFREDLYYRLNVVTLKLPDLKDRPADIDLLTGHFIKKYAEANGMPILPLSNDARAALHAHSWPGNVRELENTIHRAVLLGGPKEIGLNAIMLDSDGQARPSTGTVGSPTAQPQGGVSASGLVGRTVADVERDLIIDTLKHCIGNRTHAANILGISIRTLRNKLKLYTDQGVDVPSPGDGGQ